MSLFSMMQSVALTLSMYMWDGEPDKNTTILRVVCAVLAVVVLVILIQRRRTRVK